MDILEEIVAHKERELEQRMQFISPRRMMQLVDEKMARESEPLPSMRQAVLQSPTGIIAEFKRRSPSKGWIRREGRAGIIPLSYEQHGAAALSILTDTDYFGGYDEHVQEARQSGVTLPILYKNFVVNEYQLLQARFCGASAVLLIAACLERTACRDLMRTAHDLGLEVLLEMHSEEDTGYADLAPDLYGINNRCLGSFMVDVEQSFRLAGRLPADGCKVSESGLGGADTVSRLREAGFNGFLIGEHLMRADNPGEALRQFTT